MLSAACWIDRKRSIVFLASDLGRSIVGIAAATRSAIPGAERAVAPPSRHRR
jgi:hypothetical protein